MNSSEQLAKTRRKMNLDRGRLAGCVCLLASLLLLDLFVSQSRHVSVLLFCSHNDGVRHAKEVFRCAFRFLLCGVRRFALFVVGCDFVVLLALPFGSLCPDAVLFFGSICRFYRARLGIGGFRFNLSSKFAVRLFVDSILSEQNPRLCLLSQAVMLSYVCFVSTRILHVWSGLC